MSLTIRHTPEAGTVLEGTSRGDGVAEIVKLLRWRWSRGLEAWYVPRSRDTAPQRGLIKTTAGALKEAGHDVEVIIDGAVRPTADIEADKIARAAARAEGLRRKAERRADQAVAAAERAERAGDRLPPMGEPVKLDHYSAPRHLRALERAHRAMGDSVAARKAARLAESRAEAAAATTASRYSPTTVANRLARLQTEQNRVERELDSYTAHTIGPAVETRPAATCSRRQELQQRQEELLDEVTYWTEVRDKQIEAGLATTYGPAAVRRGDLVIIRGVVRQVVRANRATVTVTTGYSWTDRVPWHEVRSRVTEISIPDPEPNAMPLYEGLAPEKALVDGTYAALLSTDRGSEPLEVVVTIKHSRLAAITPSHLAR